MKTTFKVYSDAQHGWVAVKRNILIDLGILEQISSFSYQRGQTVYLEEDMDAGTFIRTFERYNGFKPTLVEGKWQEYSPIRSYETFSA